MTHTKNLNHYESVCDYDLELQITPEYFSSKSMVQFFQMIALGFATIMLLLPTSVSAGTQHVPDFGKKCSGKYPNPSFRPLFKTPVGLGDPYAAKLWHLESIGAYQAWKTTEGHSAVSIAVVDSGIDYNHPDISVNILRTPKRELIGWDYIRDCNLPWDRGGHGTFVAGIAAAARDNGEGTIGVCPRCGIMPIRFLNGDGFGDTEDAVLGIYFAIQNRASVINLSFAGEGFDMDLEKALLAAKAADIVVVISAGNDSENLDRSDTYPPRFSPEMPHLLVVSALKANGEVLGRSNWGKKTVNISAPGDDIWAPWLNREYYSGDGTSLAAPVVSGAVGLIRSANPKLRAEQVVQIIENTSMRLPSLHEKTKTEGTLRVDLAIRCAIDPTLPCLGRATDRKKHP